MNSNLDFLNKNTDINTIKSFLMDRINSLKQQLEIHKELLQFVEKQIPMEPTYESTNPKVPTCPSCKNATVCERDKNSHIIIYKQCCCICGQRFKLN